MRALGWFWAFLVLSAAALAAVLQLLGPPQPLQAARRAAPAPQAVRPTPPQRIERIALPNSALQEEGPEGPLPRIADDGWTPMAAYARPFDQRETRPRIGLVLTGMGLDLAASRDAIEALPSGVTLAVSPNGRSLGTMLDLARARGDELLISVPMEGQDPAEPGELVLKVDASPEDNQRVLLRVLSRFGGYVGVTGAAEGPRVARYAADDAAMAWLAGQLAKRGLLYLDPRPDATPLPGVAGRAVDLVLDDPPGRAEVEAKLAQLERLARERGSALGLAGPVRPVVIERIAAWAKGLTDRGLVLAPLTALTPPARPARRP